MSTLDDRYGTRRAPRWFWPVFAAVGIALGVAWAAWVALDEAPVSAELYAYEVVSDSRTVVTLDVRRPEPVAVTCTVQAQALDASVVGERTVELDASERPSIRLEIDIETQSRAVTGILRTCRAA
ncbi:DUF4307 domain-containing protein [Aeromicrobium sp. CF4.19]|uniref:DUF4307 domain-containing protein n=1 Tax=Aeromicrobium sp. CF4.19 TaxID=3373082 RepID=UPI003EE60EDF